MATVETRCTVEGAQTFFRIVGAEPIYHRTLRALAFTEVEGGFARIYPTDSPNLAATYRHFARSAEAMVLQAAGMRPVPWDEDLLTILLRTARHDIDWWLAGSAALAVRGLAVEPHDLDLIVDAAGAQAMGEVLSDALIGPVEDASGWIGQRFGRAFLAARIEWVGGVHAEVDEPAVTDFGPVAARQLETITWQGYPVRVPPLALQMQVSERRGLTDRVDKIRRTLGQAPSTSPTQSG